MTFPEAVSKSSSSSPEIVDGKSAIGNAYVTCDVLVVGVAAMSWSTVVELAWTAAALGLGGDSVRGRLLISVFVLL